MTKNNRKKAVAQAISTAFALGWVIMQVESAQAATLTVNNLDDNGFGSLRDYINTATSNNVAEFLLGSNPSTITLTSGALAIAGNINAYNSSNLTFTNSTISGDNVNSAGNITINSGTLIFNPGAIISKPVSEPSAIAAGSNHSGVGGKITIATNTLIVRPDALILKPVPQASAIASGSNNPRAGGNITLTTSNLILRRVPEPSAIASGSNNPRVGGNITLTTSNLILRRVPEPSAIAGTILAGSLALLAQRKQVVFRKAKV